MRILGRMAHQFVELVPETLVLNDIARPDNLESAHFFCDRLQLFGDDAPAVDKPHRCMLLH